MEPAGVSGDMVFLLPWLTYNSFWVSSHFWRKFLLSFGSLCWPLRPFVYLEIVMSDAPEFGSCWCWNGGMVAELRNVTDMEDISIHPCKKWNIGVKYLGVREILKKISSFGVYLAK